MDPSQEELYREFMDSLESELLSTQPGMSSCSDPPPLPRDPPPLPRDPPTPPQDPTPPPQEPPSPPLEEPPSPHNRTTPKWSTSQPGQKRTDRIPVNEMSDDSDQEYLPPPTQKGGARRRYLTVENHPEVAALIKDVKDYCCNPVNILRTGTTMSDETWRKTKIHLLMFFAYLLEEGVDPALHFLEDRHRVEGFLEWVQKDKTLQGGTLSTYIHHLLTGLRYLCASRGKDVQNHQMYRWMTGKRGSYRRSTTHSTAHHSWQALREKKEWIPW